MSKKLMIELEMEELIAQALEEANVIVNNETIKAMYEELGDNFPATVVQMVTDRINESADIVAYDIENALPSITTNTGGI